MTVQVWVFLFVVERARVIGVGREVQRIFLARPFLVYTRRKRHALVVFESVARVGLRVQIVGTEVQAQPPLLPFQTFRRIEKFRAHIGLQTEIQVATATFPFDFHQSTRQIAIFRRRNAANHLHALNLVGGNRAHIHAGIREVASGRLRVPSTAQILHIGIGRNGCAVDDETRAQRRSGIISTGRRSLAQTDGVRRGQHGILRPTARQKFQNVGKTRRLQVLHREFLDG